MSFNDVDDHGWLERVRTEPQCLGIPSLQYLPVYLFGAQIACQGRGEFLLRNVDWRRLEAFKSTQQWHDSTAGWWTIFIAFECRDPVQGLDRCLLAIESTEPTSEPVQLSWGYSPKNLRDLCSLIEGRPGMFLGEESATALMACMSGFVHFSGAAQGEFERLIDRFTAWHATRVGLERPLSSWLHQTWLASGVPGDVHAVLKEWNEFLSEAG